MAHTWRPTLMAIFAVLTLFVLGTSASTEKYCSPYNTATDDVYIWPYQSNGNCTSHCAETGNWAFAVIQYTDCYCSDYAPDPTYSLGDCAVGCPGFPAEHCGNKDKGLYIYLELFAKPSGTKSAGGDSEPTSSAAVQKSSTPAPTPEPSSKVPDPQTSEQILTEGGSTIIRTIIITPSANPTSSLAPVRTGENSSPNVGAIAGGVAGGIIGLLAIVGGVFFLLCRRRKQRREAEEDGHHSPNGITRNTSTMSKAGLLGRTTEVEQPYRPMVSTTFGTQSSRYGADNQSVSPISNRRNSQPLVIDSRMNPQAMIEYAGANASRESIGTIDDSRDYGRKLDVRNPDP